MSKLSSLPRVSREDLPGAPDWVDNLLQPSNEFQEQATQRLNQDLLTGVFEDYKFVHGVEQIIKNPFGNRIPRGISNVKCQGLEIDSAGKTTGKLYDLEVASTKWRVVQTRQGQPQRLGVTIRFIHPHGSLFVQRALSDQSIATASNVPIAWDTMHSQSGLMSWDAGTPTRITCLSRGVVAFDWTAAFAVLTASATFWVSKNSDSSTLSPAARRALYLQNAAAQVVRGNGSSEFDVTAGDHLELYAFQNSGSSISVVGTNAAAPTYLRARYIAPPSTATGRVTLRFDGGN